MEKSTTTTRTLLIDGMSGDGCIKKVADALKGIDGVTNQSVQLGAATITANDVGRTTALEAIGSVGFKAREDTRREPAGAASKPTPEHRTDSHAATPAAPIDAATPAAASHPATPVAAGHAG